MPQPRGGGRVRGAWRRGCRSASNGCSAGIVQPVAVIVDRLWRATTLRARPNDGVNPLGGRGAGSGQRTRSRLCEATAVGRRRRVQRPVIRRANGATLRRGTRRGPSRQTTADPSRDRRATASTPLCRGTAVPIRYDAAGRASRRLDVHLNGSVRDVRITSIGRRGAG